MTKTSTGTTKAPFVHEIRVGWGHCDPASIAFTGHLPWFALEAIDSWWETHLGGDGWFQLNIDRNIGTPFVHMSFDFSAPVTPRHRLMCEVTPVRLGTKSIEFRVIGRQDGKQCFEGRFVNVFVISDQHGKSIPAPSDIRAIIEPLLLTLPIEAK